MVRLKHLSSCQEHNFHSDAWCWLHHDVGIFIRRMEPYGTRTMVQWPGTMINWVWVEGKMDASKSLRQTRSRCENGMKVHLPAGQLVLLLMQRSPGLRPVKCPGMVSVKLRISYHLSSGLWRQQIQERKLDLPLPRYPQVSWVILRSLQNRGHSIFPPVFWVFAKSSFQWGLPGKPPKGGV